MYSIPRVRGIPKPSNIVKSAIKYLNQIGKIIKANLKKNIYNILYK